MVKVLSGSDDAVGYTVNNNTLRFHGKLYIGSSSDLQAQIIK